MKDVVKSILKAILYLVLFYFIGALVLFLVVEGIHVVFEKYIFGEAFWKMWLASTVLGGLVYWLFTNLKNENEHDNK